MIFWTSASAFTVSVIVHLMTLIRLPLTFFSMSPMAREIAALALAPSPLPDWYIFGTFISGNVASTNAIFNFGLEFSAGRYSLTSEGIGPLVARCYIYGYDSHTSTQISIRWSQRVWRERRHVIPPSEKRRVVLMNCLEVIHKSPNTYE